MLSPFFQYLYQFLLLSFKNNFHDNFSIHVYTVHSKVLKIYYYLYFIKKVTFNYVNALQHKFVIIFKYISICKELTY